MYEILILQLTVYTFTVQYIVLIPKYWVASSSYYSNHQVTVHYNKYSVFTSILEAQK